MKLKKTLAAIVAASALGIVGCEVAPRQMEGTVCSKEYRPERDDHGLLLIPNGSGGFIYVPTYNHYDEEFIITLERYSPEKKRVEAKSFYVDATTYHSLKGGDKAFCDDSQYPVCRKVE